MSINRIWVLLLIFSACNESTNDRVKDYTFSDSIAPGQNNQQQDTQGRCSQLEINQQIVSNFDYYYLFRDQMQVPVDLASLTPSQLVSKLMVTEEEAFSHWYDDKQAYLDSFSSGLSSEKFGFDSVANMQTQQIFLRFVEPYSPAWHAGFRRGDEILSINQQSVDNLFAELTKLNDSNPEQVRPYYLHYLGKTEQVTQLTLTVLGKASKVITKASYVTSSVEPVQYLQYQQQEIAYFKYHGFSQHSQSQLEAAFSEMSNQNVQALIVDLRYNSGGLLSLAEFMVNALINGDQSLNDQLMYQQRYNANLPFFNRSIYFSTQSSALTLPAITFLVDGFTCSASETVINSLLPYANVHIVGSQKTCGKPFGMNPIEICEGILFPVTLEMVNAQLDNSYKNGFVPTCLMPESALYDWADTDDPLLQQAMALAAGESCDGLQSSLDSSGLSQTERALPSYQSALGPLERLLLHKKDSLPSW